MLTSVDSHVKLAFAILQFLFANYSFAILETMFKNENLLWTKMTLDYEFYSKYDLNVNPALDKDNKECKSQNCPCLGKKFALA